MIVIAKIDEQDKDTAKALVTVSVGATNNWGETCHYLLASATVEGSPVCFEDMEILMVTFSNLDKFINTFDILNVTSGGFMKIIESAKSESICGSQTARAIYFSHSHFDLQGVDTKSRKHVHGGELSISASDAIIGDRRA